MCALQSELRAENSIPDACDGAARVHISSFSAAAVIVLHKLVALMIGALHTLTRSHTLCPLSLIAAWLGPRGRKAGQERSDGGGGGEGAEEEEEELRSSAGTLKLLKALFFRLSAALFAFPSPPPPPPTPLACHLSASLQRWLFTPFLSSLLISLDLQRPGRSHRLPSAGQTPPYAADVVLTNAIFDPPDVVTAPVIILLFIGLLQR